MANASLSVDKYCTALRYSIKRRTETVEQSGVAARSPIRTEQPSCSPPHKSIDQPVVSPPTAEPVAAPTADEEAAAQAAAAIRAAAEEAAAREARAEQLECSELSIHAALDTTEELAQPEAELLVELGDREEDRARRAKLEACMHRLISTLYPTEVLQALRSWMDKVPTPELCN